MRGEYSTRQKREMMQYLSGHGLEHYTVDGFAEAMKQEGIAVGKTTVYRFLESLAEQGKARKYQSAQGSVSFYQYVEDDSNCDAHFHLMCTQCGALFHVDCAYMSQLSGHIHAAHGFIIDPRQTVLMGVCAKCSGEEEGSGDGADHGCGCHDRL